MKLYTVLTLKKAVYFFSVCLFVPADTGKADFDAIFIGREQMIQRVLVT